MPGLVFVISAFSFVILFSYDSIQICLCETCFSKTDIRADLLLFTHHK